MAEEVQRILQATRERPKREKLIYLRFPAHVRLLHEEHKVGGIIAIQLQAF